MLRNPARPAVRFPSRAHICGLVPASDVTKGNGSSWIFEPCLTCANALQRVQHPAFALVTGSPTTVEAGPCLLLYGPLVCRCTRTGGSRWRGNTVSHTAHHAGSLSRAHRERAGRSEQVASLEDRHLTVAWGRNYIDVTPLTGVIDIDDLLGEVDVIGR